MSTASSPSARTGASSLAATSSSRSLLAFGGYLVFLLASAVIFQVWQVEQVPPGVYLLAMVALALCSLPLALWQAGNRQGAPMFELVCLAFATAYVTPVFLLENAIGSFNAYNHLAWGVTAQALQLVILGIVAMIVGHYLFTRLPMERWLPRANLPMNPRQLTQFLWLAFGMAGSVRIVERITFAGWGRGGMAVLLSLFTNLLIVGIALLGYRAFGPAAKARTGGKLLLYGVMLASVVLGLGGGMLESAFLPMVVLFIVRWHASRRFPVAWLLVGSAAFLVVNAAKYEYRSEVWFAEKSYTVLEQMETWFNKCSAVVESLTTADGQRVVLTRTIYRFDLIHTLAHVVELTPAHLPFYKGTSYEYLLYGWIPRVIWPDKPSAQTANVLFALDYGFLLDSQTDSTMIGIGFLAEGYANFGLLGVVVVMFLIGCMFGGAHVMFNGPDSDGGRAVYVSVLAYYLNGIGSNTAMFVFFGIQGFIALPLILRFFSGCWRASAPLPQPTRAQSDMIPTGRV